MDIKVNFEDQSDRALLLLIVSDLASISATLRGIEPRIRILEAWRYGMVGAMVTKRLEAWAYRLTNPLP